MQDTCKFVTCALRKRLKLKQRSECPNYLENGWRDDKGQLRTTADCAPVRTCLMIQDLYGRLVGVEESNEKQRNAGTKLLRVLVGSVIKKELADDTIHSEAQEGESVLLEDTGER